MITAKEIVPMYVNMVCMVGYALGCATHSLALIPKTEAKKDSGKKMIVTMVKIMTIRACSTAAPVCRRVRMVCSRARSAENVVVSISLCKQHIV